MFFLNSSSHTIWQTAFEIDRGQWCKKIPPGKCKPLGTPKVGLWLLACIFIIQDMLFVDVVHRATFRSEVSVVEMRLEFKEAHALYKTFSCTHGELAGFSYQLQASILC